MIMGCLCSGTHWFGTHRRSKWCHIGKLSWVVLSCNLYVVVVVSVVVVIVVVVVVVVLVVVVVVVVIVIILVVVEAIVVVVSLVYDQYMIISTGLLGVNSVSDQH